MVAFLVSLSTCNSFVSTDIFQYARPQYATTALEMPMQMSTVVAIVGWCRTNNGNTTMHEMAVFVCAVLLVINKCVLRDRSQCVHRTATVCVHVAGSNSFFLFASDRFAIHCAEWMRLFVCADIFGRLWCVSSVPMIYARILPTKNYIRYLVLLPCCWVPFLYHFDSAWCICFETNLICTRTRDAAVGNDTTAAAK